MASASADIFDNRAKQLVDCLDSIDFWMAQNGLKMNQSKTQILPIGTWQQISKINFNNIVINDSDIVFCSSATILGFIFDTNLHFHDHIKTLVSSCSFHLEQFNSCEQ